VHRMPVPYSNAMSYRRRIASFVQFAVGASTRATRVHPDVVLARAVRTDNGAAVCARDEGRVSVRAQGVNGEAPPALPLPLHWRKRTLLGPRDSLKSQHPPAGPDGPEEPTANGRHRVSLGPAPATQPEVRALDEAIQSR